MLTSPDTIRAEGALPEPFAEWFSAQGWTPRPHQLALIEKAEEGRSTLLIAPTGAGKTLAGFLPSLIEITDENRRRNAPLREGPHTLYISPLKALAVDIARNLERPITEMGLPIAHETRTGDTPQNRRRRQKEVPPDILLTTAEQIALLVSQPDAARFFSELKVIIVDELHSLVTSKRGDLLSLGIARLRRHAPEVRTIGLSATVAEPDDLRGWLVPFVPADPSSREDDGRGVPKRRPAAPASGLADLIVVEGGAKPDLSILKTDQRVPWSGHMTRWAVGDVYRLIKEHGTTLVFVNTRSQAETLFYELWRINEDTLPIALHHGSLEREQRRKVEAAMARNALRAVVCTSTLDLGIDWGDVDLVIHVGAPKGASRLAQRIGRANHRMDEPSKAILVPSNRFEVMECQAALDASYLGHQDTPPIKDGALDVLAQHVVGMAVADAFDAIDLYEEIRSAYPYRTLDWETFERVVDFAATGGYALRAYERYAKIRRRKDGLWRITHPDVAKQYRLNVGTIVELAMLPVRLVSWRRGILSKRGPILGQLEEYFLSSLAPGDTFLFSGQVLKLEAVRDNEVLVTKTAQSEPKIPYYGGSKFPLTTYLASVVRQMLADPDNRTALPEQVRDWLELQGARSRLPKADELLVETFPRGQRHYLVAYPFEGRLAHQTLGMLLTRRMERAGLHPMGFVASDYALAVWALSDLSAHFDDAPNTMSDLFSEDMLGDDLDEWLADSMLMKRTFRAVAQIAHLVERRHPGQEKTGRQITLSTDLIYDVLRSHEPDHILLRATWQDAATGLLDIRRLGQMLARVKHDIVHVRLPRISPLAVPIMLEIGREPVQGEGTEQLLADAAEELVREAMG
ncbi:ligase-associated DNA damage response DEXH box helicase [Acuticoccus sediminis]|uniref:Ligase-associated DNA damage response DEXH box helicase n=1 Tax=Acuticoccus sediminis TaxID=2184697 RepID=A0A8B2NT87_9HYPH|nr:ligase-associated DNA damage response DEXH box helicase [Acuticoccus sediminis]RAI03427.1 ligase-associated DNA damage response DEXH box helicase [Acuticoccus sediminis]